MALDRSMRRVGRHKITQKQIVRKDIQIARQNTQIHRLSSCLREMQNSCGPPPQDILSARPVPGTDVGVGHRGGMNGHLQDEDYPMDAAADHCQDLVDEETVVSELQPLVPPAKPAEEDAVSTRTVVISNTTHISSSNSRQCRTLHLRLTTLSWRSPCKKRRHLPKKLMKFRQRMRRHSAKNFKLSIHVWKKI